MGRRLASALGALCVVGAPSGEAQALPDAKAARRFIFWRPAETIWTGQLPIEACAVGRALLVSPVPAAALRNGSYARSGELIAEIRAPANLAPGVTRNAQSCAREAFGAVGAEKLLSSSATNWSAFSTAFGACLRRSNSQTFVGSMTLWVDHDCVM